MPVGRLSLEAVAMIVFGAVLVAHGLMQHGALAPRSTWAKRMRAQYAYRSPALAWLPVAPRRMFAAMPFAGIATICLGVASISERGSTPWIAFAIPGFGSLVVGGIASIWPGPFVPKWIHDADRRRALGLAPEMPPPEDLVSAQRMTEGEFRLGMAAAVVLIGLNAVLGGPTHLTTGLLAGVGILIAMRAARRSG